MANASSGRRSPAANRIKALAAVVTVASVFAYGAMASAQVLELGTTGVTTYDRPAVFDGQGSKPIIIPRVRMARGVISHPPAIAAAAVVTQVSEDLIAAVAWSESRMRAHAVSPAGALGEMQLMPATARSLGVNPADTGQNYRGGATYLHGLLARYDGDLVKALAAYNAGPGAVDHYGGVPPFRETQAYVAAVLERLSLEAENSR